MNVSKSTYLLTLILLLLGTTVSAQNEREKLESQKSKLQAKIKETERILSQTSNKKQSSLGRLKALNNQIQSRTSLINAIRNEVSLLDDDIEENQFIIEAMENDLNDLRDEYAEMVYTTYKTSQGYNELTFLFASGTFNQLFMRMKYIKQYSQARKKQGEQIQIVQGNLKDQIEEIEEQKSSKQSLLDEELSENKKLENLQGEQRTLVSRLTRQESKIKQDLQQQRKSEKELTNRIESIIEAERRAAVLASVDMSSLNEAFEKERGKLPWPVSNGFVSSKFGVHRHPTLKRVTQNNPGIDIQTSVDAEVRSIFPGKVLGIVSIEGMGNSIIIQHGNYFSVYSRLKSVNVRKGDEVGGAQVLGRVLTDSQNVSELKFRIHDQKGSINPELWLGAKN
ncbi:MAG: peptidoglycan DD-metalloendopeptidase family protein [Roseivirga sp.]|nr:peptidoglycan DD-metalloendopeptidase family protein [Roseivirga sp.]